MPGAIHRARERLLREADDRRLRALAEAVRSSAPAPAPGQRHVIFFNASTRLGGISLNAAFATLSAMALQMRGVPVHFFACRQGLERCTLGAIVNGPEKTPPCRTCIRQSETLFSSAPVTWFAYQALPELDASLQDLSVPEMASFTHSGIPLGALTLPSLRWTLRVHHLEDDEPTRRLFRAFIRSAYGVVRDFSAILDAAEPVCVVVFNGISYPEAAARWAALQRGIRVVTHEVAHQPLTAFFTDGEVTAYPVDIPQDFELNEAQNARLDGYLSKRFQGDFSMAGLEFWPEMKDLDSELREKIAAHEQLVPVFTNVIFDTSQVHANTLFEHMFAWLDQIHEIIRAHPETLFVIRAHPDELRPNSRKQARETVAGWVEANGVDRLPNAVFIPPLEYASSYALVQRAKFVMAYNSTIGLEASLMGKPVLNGGRARYTQVDCVHLPESADEHRRMAEEFLKEEQLEQLPEHRRSARRFAYYQLWRTPIPFDAFIEPARTRGYVHLKDFSVDDLKSSTALNVIGDGILGKGDFLMKEE